jgi:hypothetical protein
MHRHTGIDRQFYESCNVGVKHGLAAGKSYSPQTIPQGKPQKRGEIIFGNHPDNGACISREAICASQIAFIGDFKGQTGNCGTTKRHIHTDSNIR